MSKAAKILIAEDEKLLRRAYADGLTHAGFTVTVAENGEEAVEALRKEIPDLILLDLLMPKMSGYDVLKVIKADPALSKIPTVVLSNLGRPTGTEELAIIGNTKFVIKSDCSLRDLTELIHSMTVA
jgi:CheY-like chemotaxis protein